MRKKLFSIFLPVFLLTFGLGQPLLLESKTIAKSSGQNSLPKPQYSLKSSAKKQAGVMAVKTPSVLGAQQKNSAAKIKFAADAIIVKFKIYQPSNLSLPIAQYNLEKAKHIDSKLNALSVKQLRKKHKVTALKQIFKRTLKEKSRNKSVAKSLEQEFPRLKYLKKRPVAVPDLTTVYSLKLERGADVQVAAAEFAQDPNVEYAQPDYLVEKQWVPNDPYYQSAGSWGQSYDDLWGLKKLQLEQAWEVTKGEGITVAVAVVDTGLDYVHSDIAANVWVNSQEVSGNGIDDDGNGFIDDIRGWDFAYNNNDITDKDGHGTHVAGTIAAVGNNNLGVVGVAPQAKLMGIKGLNDVGSGQSSWLASAIIYAAQNGAKVINNSWGCSYCPSNPIIEDAVKEAYSRGVVLVFAAGNSNDDVLNRSPQNMMDPKPIIVGASDQFDQKSSFASYGMLMDFVAPGGGSGRMQDNQTGSHFYVNILSLRASGTDLYSGSSNYTSGEFVVGEQYYRARGTSMAAPHAAGAAALVLAARPNSTNEEVRQILRAAADDIAQSGPDAATGAGRLNVAAALSVTSVPQVKINSPADGTVVAREQGVVTIKGSASGDNVVQYQLFYGAGLAPTDWTPIGNAAPAMTDSVLGEWNVADRQSGDYWLRLDVVTSDSFTFRDFIHVELEPYPTEQIAGGPTWQYKPAVADNLIGWIECANVIAESTCNSYLYDVSVPQRKPQKISVDGYVFYLAISGQRVIWYQNGGAGGAGIYLCNYDAAGGGCPAYKIRIDYTADIAIDGDRVVWVGRGDSFGKWDIYSCTYNPATRACPSERITSSGTAYWPVDISGDLIVWPDSRNGNLDIYVYNLARPENGAQLITNNGAEQSRPSISETRIAWQDGRYGNPDIFFCDYDAVSELCPEQQITNNQTVQSNPGIDGNLIVWQDSRNGNDDIYLYNLARPEDGEVQITSNKDGQAAPVVSGRRIVWQDSRRKDVGDTDIYGAIINHAPVLSLVGGKTVKEGELLNFTVSADDRDGDTLSYSAEPLSSGAAFIFSPPTFNWLPTYEQAGIYQTQFKVQDTYGFSDAETITVSVLESSLPATTTPPTATTTPPIIPGVFTVTLLKFLGTTDRVVTLAGGVSNLSPGTYVAKYEWDYTGDGIWDYSSGAPIPQGSVDYLYNTAGVYTAALRVTDNLGQQVTASTRVTITTTGTGTTTPMFTAISPAAGDILQVGKTYAIKWQFSSNAGNLATARISLYKNGGYQEWVAIDIPNNGSYNWLVPTSAPVGPAYSVRIFNPYFPNDFSDSGVFSISSL